jgi:hypothetical protein
MADKQRSEETRARKAQALRANLRKRKAATRKQKAEASVEAVTPKKDG